MTIDAFVTAVQSPPADCHTIYLRIRSGRSVHRSRVVATEYLSASELLPSTIQETIDELREQAPAGARAWIDAVPAGSPHGYAGPVEVDPRAPSSSSSLPTVAPVGAAPGSEFGVTVHALVQLAAHHVAVTDRLLDTVDRYAIDVAELRERVGRASVRAAVASTTDDDDDEPRRGALGALAETLAQVARKVATETAAPPSGEELVSLARRHFASLSADERIRQIGRFAELAEELAGGLPDELQGPQEPPDAAG